MRTRPVFRALLLLSAPLFNNCNGQATQTPTHNPLQQIQESHIEANVPDESRFAAFMQRDLEEYFSDDYGKKVTVQWEFLREGATQSGVAYPKYYLWTKIYVGEKFLNEGAVRVAAIEKTTFEVTNFVSIDEIKKKKQDIYLVFPAPVCEKIKAKIH
ncbi:hypothetical protein [Salmonirosea aquatica]|uniref:Lipoprotein n=1 Tax=Salmonirosea aquatica TaxID=2654236 RepID=A0A7C9FZ48_9BACT|nr:hypothetical protein [Cytophagaceae bacterium SJW1-29]